jgi:hypothetical protein
MNKDQDPIMDYENFSMMYNAMTIATIRITNQSLLIVSNISFMIDRVVCTLYQLLKQR